jgi:hypothetical protein
VFFLQKAFERQVAARMKYVSLFYLKRPIAAAWLICCN